MSEARQDYLDKDGAEALGKQISGYWRSCGFEIDVRVEFLAGSGIWVIRSGLAGGLPPRVR
jgi:hypothetical protein